MPLKYGLYSACPSRAGPDSPTSVRPHARQTADSRLFGSSCADAPASAHQRTGLPFRIPACSNIVSRPWKRGSAHDAGFGGPGGRSASRDPTRQRPDPLWRSWAGLVEVLDRKCEPTRPGRWRRRRRDLRPRMGSSGPRIDRIGPVARGLVDGAERQVSLGSGTALRMGTATPEASLWPSEPGSASIKGSSLWAQLLPFIAGQCGILAIYFLVRYWRLARWLALTAAFVVSVSPIATQYSTHVKEYSTDFLVACFVLWRAEAARRSPDKRQLIIFGVGSGVAVLISGFRRHR